MIIFNKYFLFIFITFTLVSNAQEWDFLSSYDADSRHHPITFSSNNYGFVIAGQSGVTGQYLSDVHRYDVASDSWEEISSFPGGPRGYAYGVSNGIMAYVGFGSNGPEFPNDWWQYEIETDVWTPLADFPSFGRNHPALIIVDNYVYVGLGGNSSGNLGDWWQYNIQDNIWSQKANFDFGDRHHPFYFGIDDTPYVGFGHGDYSNGQITIYNDFYKYDVDSDNWIQLNNFPSEGRVAGTQFSYNGKGYVLSGDGDDHGPLDSGELWEYTPETDSWNSLPSHPGNARWAPGCFVINCDVYFTSGYDRETGIYFNDLIKFELGQDCGCTDSNAANFNSTATIDDNSCCYISGCTDPTALNFNSDACYDDGSCIAVNLGCLDSLATNYDIFANSYSGSGGPINQNELGIGSYHLSDQYHMIFNTYQDVNLNSVDVYAAENFSVQIEILDNNDEQIFTNSFNLIEGLNTLNIDFNIPFGNDYKIGILGENNGLFRNNDVQEGVFPISIFDVIDITQSNANNPEMYYYYFYNWQVSVECQIAYGCTDTTACNYDINAVVEDNSCLFPEQFYNCNGDCINDIDEDGICDELEVESWNCNDVACIESSDGNGEYLTLESCLATCIKTDIINLDIDRKLKHITNLLGEEIKFKHNEILIYKYDDGSFEKKIIFE